ncbi:3674_t:CDS:2 [Diversispora eburnea]|uniref:3674_t:CDS:1 n=1 Tax=Diversispora eburnea TaxID=1213867 RepID=A0A9N9AUB4_9GLOM|nr:3674_t:CDS:2 [Diversispora eburnea]
MPILKYSLISYEYEKTYESRIKKLEVKNAKLGLRNQELMAKNAELVARIKELKASNNGRNDHKKFDTQMKKLKATINGVRYEYAK